MFDRYLTFYSRQSRNFDWLRLEWKGCGHGLTTSEKSVFSSLVESFKQNQALTNIGYSTADAGIASGS